MTKTCKNCKIEMNLDFFYTFYDKWSNKRYPSSRCKTCHQDYKKNNPNKTKNAKSEKLKLRYGLTYEEWEKIREEINYSCMICGITELELDRKLDVDHCHNSGKVRGCLCNHCNGMLGHARDNISILKEAIKYLETYGGGYK